MGFFGKMFEKKVCDLCGGEIGLLGNRKLEDGSLCKACGAELLCDETTAATSCPYCGNPTVVPGQFAGARRPDCILPFRLEKEARCRPSRPTAAKTPSCPGPSRPSTIWRS